jgi:hypothetical protein
LENESEGEDMDFVYYRIPVIYTFLYRLKPAPDFMREYIPAPRSV